MGGQWYSADRHVSKWQAHIPGEISLERSMYYCRGSYFKGQYSIHFPYYPIRASSLIQGVPEPPLCSFNRGFTET
jgi:hypothetical protein